jgi:hypothetical protein
VSQHGLEGLYAPPARAGVTDLIDGRSGAPVEVTQQKLTALAGRLRTAEAERDTWRRKYNSAVRERERERSRADAMAHSRSYLLGRAIVLLVRNPIKNTPKVVRAALRRLVHRRRLVASAAQQVPRQPVAPVAAAKRVKPPAARGAIPPVLSETLPVHAYVAFGLDLDGLRSLARAVGQCALATGGHVPLVITDMPSFSLLRETGVAIEYVPSRHSWNVHRPDVGWEAFQAERLGRLLKVHQVTRTFFVNRTEPLNIAQLLAINSDTQS